MQSRGAALVPIMNALKSAAMTAHWEFAWGPDGFKTLAARHEYPFLAINCYDAVSGELFFPPSKVIERRGESVGLIGIACNIIDKTLLPAHTEGVRFTLKGAKFPGWIAHLRRCKPSTRS